MAQEVGIDALGDAGAVGDLADDLTDALSGEGRRTSITSPLTADEQWPSPAAADVQGHKTGQLGTHRHLAAFAAFSVLDDNGALGRLTSSTRRATNSETRAPVSKSTCIISPTWPPCA